MKEVLYRCEGKRNMDCTACYHKDIHKEIKDICDGSGTLGGCVVCKIVKEIIPVEESKKISKYRFNVHNKSFNLNQFITDWKKDGGGLRILTSNKDITNDTVVFLSLKFLKTHEGSLLGEHFYNYWGHVADSIKINPDGSFCFVFDDFSHQVKTFSFYRFKIISRRQIEDVLKQYKEAKRKKVKKSKNKRIRNWCTVLGDF